MNLTPRELANVLLGLRILQSMPYRNLQLEEHEVLDGHALMDAEEIDELCEKINVVDGWTGVDRGSAQAEGWDIFETDGAEEEAWRNSVLLICRDDEANRFSCDEEALMYVIERAQAGSELHQRALQHHMTIRED